jgi:DNA-binding transcriptional LysR family regulator
VDLTWIEDFLTLASTHSFSKAAALRHVTQSALSRRIQALETWIGAPLVDRSTYPTSLTAAGRQFRGVAEEVVRMLHEERRSLQSQNELTGSTIKIAALHALSLRFLPEWLKRVERSVGPIGVHLVTDDFQDSINRLVEGECDFLLTYYHSMVPVFLDPVRFPYVTLGADRLVLVTGVDVDGNPYFPLSQFVSSPIPFLGYPAESFLGRLSTVMLNDPCRRLQLRKVYENGMAEAVKAMVLAGHGIAWLPETSVREELGRLTVQVMDIPANGSMEIRIYRSLDRTRPLADTLWSFLSANPTLERLA